MKFYMSYWSGGYQQIPQSYIIDYHRLSAHYLKKHYGEVHLITDSVGKDSLEDVGYTTISTELDSLPRVSTSTINIIHSPQNKILRYLSMLHQGHYNTSWQYHRLEILHGKTYHF